MLTHPLAQRSQEDFVMPRLRMKAVTPTTPCPGVFGGTMRHYPRCVDSVPITMSGVPTGNRNEERTVMLAFCGDKLLPPDEREDGTAEGVVLCHSCVRALREAIVASRNDHSPELRLVGSR